MLSIQELKNFSLKSFENYSTGENYFKRNNYFYGENGDGKTSLLLGVRNLCESEGIRYEYYSKDFANNMILLEEDCLHGVKLTLGKENVQTKKLLQQKRIEISQIESQYDLKNIQDIINVDFNKLDKKHTTIFNQQKGTTKIRKKPLQLDTLNSSMKSYQEEVKMLQSKFNPNILLTNADGNIYEETLLSLNAIEDLHNLTYVIDWGNLAQILKTEFELLSIDHTILKWIEEGKKIHEKDGIIECQFCKSKFNATDRIREINNIITNETKKKQDELNAFVSTLVNMENNISRSVIDAEVLISNKEYNDIYGEFKQIKKDLSTYLANLTATIKDKIKNMNTSIVKDSIIIQECIKEYNTATDNLNAIKATLIATIKTAISRINDIAKYNVAKSILEDVEIETLIKKIDDNTRLKEEGNQKLENIISQIKNLEMQQSDVSDIAILINTALQHTNININLVVDNENYRLELRSDSKIKLNVENISEGEKGFIAFLYWYFRLFKKIGVDVKEELNKEIKVIIVDDPICSLDNKNNTYLISLLDNLIKHDVFQVFIAFHEWRDFTNLIYGKKNDKNNPKHKFINVQKKLGVSRLESTKSNTTFYKRMYKEIYFLSEKDILDEEDVLRAPNYMRRCLETYLRFNYGIETATSNSETRIIEKLEVSNHQKAAFSTLLKVCNIFSHGDAFLHDPSPEEVKSSIKCFITVMKAKDKGLHHNVMVQS